MPQLKSIFSSFPPRYRKKKLEALPHKHPDPQASRQLAQNYLSFLAARNMLDSRIEAVKNTDSGSSGPLSKAFP